MTLFSSSRCFLAGTLGVLGTLSCWAQETQSFDLGEGLFMVQGKGGNVLFSVGEDGGLMVDTQFGSQFDVLKRELAKISNQGIRYLLNTHWHYDHTGGNPRWATTGPTILGHANVLARLSKTQTISAFGKVVEPLEAPARPTLTYQSALDLVHNGEQIRILHAPRAHTDGDSQVFFLEPNVCHLGDTFFHGFYPFVDTSSGGSLKGLIAAGRQALELVDEETKIVPGHGPLATKANLEAYVAMLSEVNQVLQNLVRKGLDDQAIQAKKPTAKFDPVWGGGFLSPEKWVEILLVSVREEVEAEVRARGPR